MTISKLSKILTEPVKKVAAVLPATAGEKGHFQLTQLPIEAGIKPALLKRIFGSTTGYHGTSTKALGEQLKKRQFENRSKKIYFGTLEEAVHYAAKRSLSDKSQPLVLKIYSEQAPKGNELLPSQLEGHGVSIGLGDYSYLSTENNPVYIQKAYKPEKIK